MPTDTDGTRRQDTSENGTGSNGLGRRGLLRGVGASLLGAVAVVGSTKTASAAPGDSLLDDADDTNDSNGANDATIGGGEGYDRIVTEADADAVVDTADGLDDALSGASSGDVVFVAGDATIETGGTEFDVPAGVTVASDRGRDGSPGALLTTAEEPDAVFHVGGDDARITGLRLRGAFPDSYVTHQDGISYSNDGNTGIEVASSGAEIDNCEIYGFVLAAIYVESGDGSTHVHHSFVHQNNTQGLGYGVAVGYDESADPLVEYNYFDANRHSVTSTGENYGYTARYNHFGPTSVMHPIDIHDPGSEETTIENNVVETRTRTWDDNPCPSVDGFEGTDGVVHIEGNWFWNDTSTFDVPTDDSGVEVTDNDYGEDVTTFADVVPNHPGAEDRPWA